MDMFILLTYQVVYSLCVHFSICMLFQFKKKKASLTKLSKTQSKNLSVNTFFDDRKINSLNIYQAKNKEKIFS